MVNSNRLANDFLSDYEKIELGLEFDGEVHFVKGWYSDKRENRDILPNGFWAYDFRESDLDEDDENWDYREYIEPFVAVNHSGTFVCNIEIPFGINGNPMSIKPKFWR